MLLRSRAVGGIKKPDKFTLSFVKVPAPDVDPGMTCRARLGVASACRFHMDTTLPEETVQRPQLDAAPLKLPALL